MKGFRLRILCAVAVFAGGTGIASEERPPNVVIIYGDDVGLGDVGVYGSKLIPTPNIDRLAKEGCSAMATVPPRPVRHRAFRC